MGGMNNQQSREAAKEVLSPKRNKERSFSMQHHNISYHLSFRIRASGEEPAFPITNRVGRTLLSANVRTTTTVNPLTPDLVVLRKRNLRNATLPNNEPALSLPNGPMHFPWIT
jgi:hypothetical protein